MRIVLTTKAGKQSFERVKIFTVVGNTLYIYIVNAKKESDEINKRELENCISMEVDFENPKATGRADTTTKAT